MYDRGTADGGPGWSSWCERPGTFVKVTAGADGYNPCAGDNWTLVALSGPAGPTGMRGMQGPAGTANVHWARVDSSGTLTAWSSDKLYAGWFDTGGYYFGASNLDLTKCAISITPDRRHPDDLPASPEIYETYSSYTMFYMKRIKPNVWPLKTERVNAAFYISASCT